MVPCSPDDCARPLLNELLHLVGGEMEDRGTIDTIIRRQIKQSRRHVAEEMDVMPLCSMPMRQLHQSQVGHAAIEMCQAHVHGSISFGCGAACLWSGQ